MRYLLSKFQIATTLGGESRDGKRFWQLCLLDKKTSKDGRIRVKSFNHSVPPD